MIPVSNEFTIAQQADVAQYVQLTNLILGNYAASGAGSTASSNGDDASGNYPAAGSIDGDRTEINIGAPANADNGVGLSSWKAASNPSGGSPNILTIQFGQSRTFNRLKLYNLAANPLTSYIVEYSVDGSTGWTAFAGTPDQYTPPIGSYYGWGSPGGWGGGPWGGAMPFSITGGLDQYETPSNITAKAFRVRVFATNTGGPAQIVELEIYRKVDISSRLIGLKVDRKKDFKLAQPISTQLNLTLDNKDQFFSLFYAPIASQAAAYVNAEWEDLGINVEVNEGFITYAGPQLIRTFTGSVDTINNNVKPGQAQVVARDFMKHLINQYDSCNLKTSIDITACIQYLLNRNNVSNYEMNLFTTTIVLAYFFAYQTQILTTIQSLVQAAGDALFYFDEAGYATFQYYLSNAPQNNTINTQGGWQSGTLQNLDATTTPGVIVSSFTVVSGAFSNFFYDPVAFGGNNGEVLGGTFSGVSLARIPSTQVYGWWSIRMASSGTPTLRTATDFIYDSGSGNYYSLSISQTNLILYKNTTPLLTVTTVCGSSNVLVVTRTAAGLFTIYKDGVSIGTVTDNTLTTCTGIQLRADTNDSAQWLDGKISSNLSGANPSQFLTPLWQSPTIDRTSAVTAAGSITAVASQSSGTATYNVYTSSSPDGSTWSNWLQTGAGGADLSPVARYVRYQLMMTSYSAGSGFLANNPETIYNTSITWFTGSGQQKWSPTVNFNISANSPIKDMQAQVSDNLGGSTAVINDVAVTSAPLILGGSGTSTVWQGVTGSPPAAIAAGNPLAVSAGTLVFNITIPGGMDVSQFGAANTGSGGGGIALTFAGGATGTATVTYAHPTKPVLTIVITHAGTITDLRLIGLTFQNLQTPYQALSESVTSIMKNRRRHADVENDFIVSNGIAGIIASKTISNFKDPVLWLPKVDCYPPILNCQPGDQFNVQEPQSAVNQNFYLNGFSRSIEVKGGKASVSQSLVLMVVT